ncbi:MAG: c-type cytochrome [Candidatus Acidiferrales bacterium]
MRKCLISLLILLCLILAGGAIFLSQFSISAIPDPGGFETRMATASLHAIVARRARREVPAEPPATATSVAAGGMTFGGECANCHGTEGDKPTDVGRGMYPRAPSLASHEVQGWSNAELFYIIRNGVRYTGMPGFGKSLPDDQIWTLVYYVRSLAPQKSGTPAK